MPLWKTPSGVDKQIIVPRRWVFVKFDKVQEMPLPELGWSIMEAILRVEYPRTGCPTTLRMRMSRWPNSSREDETGHDEKNPIPGMTRHHHWQHFILNRPDLTVGIKVWHNGTQPIVLDGRQFKTTRFK
jgi:hypothetical protein